MYSYLLQSNFKQDQLRRYNFGYTTSWTPAIIKLKQKNFGNEVQYFEGITK